MTTVPGQEDFKADLYFVFYTDVNSPQDVHVTGTAEEKELLFKHIEVHRFSLDTTVATQEFRDRVRLTLARFGFDDDDDDCVIGGT